MFWKLGRGVERVRERIISYLMMWDFGEIENERDGNNVFVCGVCIVGG